MRFPHLFRLIAPIAILTLQMTSTVAMAQSGHTRENLMVVVRETAGENKQDERLLPFGKIRSKMPDGRDVEAEPAWWSFIGDMHVRFVFDKPQTMEGAMPGDLERLGVPDVDRALVLAMANLERIYGAPTASEWTTGVMLVHGKSPDVDSSYILDRSFWRDVLKQHPEGLVVAVPKRGGLLYSALTNQAAVDSLRKGVGYLYSSSGNLRVSSALYLFRDDKWSVLQAPIKQ